LIQATTSAPSVLVAIASHGTAQDHYLSRVLAEYRKLERRVRAVVLSNVVKPVPGAEVVAGLPSPNPCSLPFAHRKLFGENAAGYDLFIYSEDDTLITERHIDAFLDAQSKLRDDEIAGFIRSESAPDGSRFITSIHHHFKWQPDSVVERGGDSFASLTNQHSGCFIATRAQIQKAIASGGFLVPPHAERYGMLETAASDLYTQCGLRRVISLSRIHDFIVPHLPNKYYPSLGIPIEELDLQVRALSEIHRNDGWTGGLYEPESGAPGFRWSKDHYEKSDTKLLASVPASTRSVLSVGCGWGATEMELVRRGIEVCAIPVDAVFGESLRRRGIRAVTGPLAQALEKLREERFDAILLADVLHLVPDPVDWLRRTSALLQPSGRVIVSVPNTLEIGSRVRHWREGRRRLQTPREGATGVHRVNAKRLRRWFDEAGLTSVRIVPAVDETGRPIRKWASAVLGTAAASRFLVTAVCRESNR
jgi:2-polyprenyl-3-methyl-5-hydroxy-6-metoxy-1,4-benzoquinol methylase